MSDRKIPQSGGSGDYTEVTWTGAGMIAALVASDLIALAAIMLVPFRCCGSNPIGLRIGLAAVVALLAGFAFFTFFRITIRLGESSFRFAFGRFGHTIPYESVRSVEAARYHWRKFGGWGIRWAIDGDRAFNVMGDGGKAIRVAFERGGVEYTYYVSCRDPEALAERIRARLPAGVRQSGSPGA